MANTLSTKPLIAILGSTGTGKTKLAVELAHSLLARLHPDWNGAEVVNADSMQVYRGLDVITNKVTVDEMRGVPHHLLGFKDIGEQYTVHEWIKDTLPIVNRLQSQQRVPFVVGGTAYWIQHLVFPDRLAMPTASSNSTATSAALATSLDCLSDQQRILYETVSELPSDSLEEATALALHQLLLQMDPQIGARWHWRDSRKVIRSLEVIKENGCLASELYAEQSASSSKPRYRTLFFWLNAVPQVLNPRLDARIEQMTKLGLLDEIRTMRKLAQELPQPIDYSQGIFQTIGYKEFSDYLDDPATPQPLYDASMEKMRVSTRKYAKRQITWITGKLLPVCGETEDADIVVLDAGADDWDTEVIPRAKAALQRFLQSQPIDNECSSPSMRHLLAARAAKSPLESLAAQRKTTCEVCTADPRRPYMVDEALWREHASTRQHRRALKRAENHRQWQTYKSSHPTSEPGGSSSETEVTS